jgi:nucleoside phosphorylase
MRILVTFAVEAEFAPWRRLREFRKLDSTDSDGFSSRIGDGELIVLLTGMGCKRAWLQATKVIWGGDVDLCISTGLAGALRPEHTLGQTLVPANVLAAKWDRVVPCDPMLIESAASAGAKKVSSFYTADHVIVRAEEKQRLGTLADAVEMESGEILFQAAAFGARVVAVRSISDSSGEDLPLDFNKVSTKEGDVSIRKIVQEVVGSPGSIPSLIRFGQQSRQAAETLAVFLERFVRGLAVSPEIPSYEVMR